MALRMVTLTRAADGRWFARKGIPKDVREEYARLYGVRREAQLKLPADTAKHDAKTQLGEWIAEIETQIATLRAQRKGEGQPLTKINAIALAGRWYTWFVRQYEVEPWPAKRWRELGEHLVWDVLYPHAPDSYLEDPKADPHWEWVKDPDVREAVRPQIAEEARVARFLASEGLALNNDAYALFVDAVGDNLYPAFELLARRADGDYSPDTTPESFPPFVNGPAGKPEGLGCWDLFEAFVKATKPADTTVQRWRAVFLEMQRKFADVGANGITEDAARSWVRGLVSEERSALTVREVWLSSSRRVFSWGVEHKHVHTNPFTTIKVDVPKKAQTRETGKAFTPEEAQTILKASLACENPKTPWERAKRWVPWLCAYSGARSGEITQLRGRDIEQRGRFYVMKLTVEAGTIKTGQTRVVPIHEHLIDQGFPEMVRGVGSGALFYNDRQPAKTREADPLKPSRSRAQTTRAHLGDWVRSLGITDKVSPNHAWRHTFKQIADRAGIPEKIHDAITGHAPASEGRKYGAPTVDDMAKALRKFPRYKLNSSSSATVDCRVSPAGKREEPRGTKVI
jgi:integrase